ncbi:MAG: hypothetical protein JO112_16345 [Planctomycetes bacterium]|nr:hypothetical protein [Planctomycetota bacterium]
MIAPWGKEEFLTTDYTDTTDKESRGQDWEKRRRTFLASPLAPKPIVSFFLIRVIRVIRGSILRVGLLERTAGQVKANCPGKPA